MKKENKMLIPAPFKKGETLKADNDNQEIHDRIAAVYWNTIGADGSTPLYDLNMATIFFIKTRKGCFGVTNNHVYEGYITAEKNGWFRMETYIDAVEIELDHRLVGRDEYLDLATFRFTEDEIKSFGVKFFDYSHGEWATKALSKTDEIAFGGFPIGRRYVKENDNDEEQATIYIDKLVRKGNVNDMWKDKISLIWDWHNRRISDGNRNISHNQFLPEVFDLGGFSGAPLLFRSTRRNIADGWELGGVIFEGKPLTDIGPDLFYATPIRFISEDGSITRDLV